MGYVFLYLFILIGLLPLVPDEYKFGVWVLSMLFMMKFLKQADFYKGEEEQKKGE